VSFREPNGAVMTNMKPKGGASIEASSLRGLQGRPATGLNGQAAKEEVSALSRGGWMPENISGVPAGRSVFHLTSPLIGLLGAIPMCLLNHVASVHDLLCGDGTGRVNPSRFFEQRQSLLELSRLLQ